MSSLSARGRLPGPQNDLLPLQDPRFPEDRQELAPVRAMWQGLLRLRRQRQRRQGLTLVIEPQDKSVLGSNRTRASAPSIWSLEGPSSSDTPYSRRSWRQSSSPP